MINPQEEAIKRLMQMAKSGSQRTPLVPRVTSDPESPPVGMLWIRDDEQKAYLQTADNTALLVASATQEPGDGGTIISDRSLPGVSLMLNTVTSDEIASGAVGTAELGSQSVSGDKWAPQITAQSSLTLSNELTPSAPGLLVNVPFDQAADIARFEFDGDQRMRMTTTHFSIGADLPNSSVSIQTDSTETALRVRGSGGPILLEGQTGNRLLSVDGSGNLIIAGAISSLSGDSNATGSMSVNGALTVTDQANLLAGLQVAERVDFLAELEVDGQTTLNGEVFLPPNYSAKIGNAVHLRTLLANENRLLLEGVSAIGEAEIQLGTGGPVLRGSFEEDDSLYIGDEKILTSGSGGIRGNQIATDTLTGATGSNVGNIAAETITGYNIKNGSITSTELSPGAVVAGAIAAGAVGSVELADGSVIDRVVASLGVGKLISGTLNADEVFMGPSGHIYLGPTFTSEIEDERIQIDASGIRAYDSFNIARAEFTPGGFTLRTGVDGARLEIDATNGIELFGTAGERTGYLSPLGLFQLDSAIDGARMSLNSNEGVQFYAGATKNLAYNPGFIGSSEHELAVAGEALDDQRHVFAGEWAVRFRCTNPNVNAPSYVDVPFRNTVGTGSSVSRTRVNECANPKLDSVITNWSGLATTAQTASRVAVLGFIGGFAAQVQATADGAASISAPLVTVAAAQQWALSVSARVSTGQNVVAEILWYDVNSLLVKTDSSTPFALIGNVVAQVGMVGIAPSNATSARLRITASLLFPDTLQVSDCLYERASGIDAYADGDTEGYEWVGSDGISKSSLIPVPVLDSPDNLVSIFVWSDVTAWAQIEGRDSTANVSRGMSPAMLLTPNQWSRVVVPCTGVMDKVRLHYPSTDPSRQTRILGTPVWWSGLQVEADKDIPTPFCAGNEPGCRWEALEAQSASIRDRDVVVTQISPTLGTTVSGAIVGGSLTSASFFAGRIFGTEITGGKIFGNVITGNQINGDQILAGTITSTSIAARTITAGDIAVDTLTGTEILAGSINADRLTAGTITANQIGANQITAAKLAANLIVAGTAGGNRVEISQTLGIEQWFGGVRTLRIPPNGAPEFSGLVTAGAPRVNNVGAAPSVVINPDTATIALYPNNTARRFQIRAWNNTLVGTGGTGPVLDIAAFNATSQSRGASLQLSASSDTVGTIWLAFNGSGNNPLGGYFTAIQSGLVETGVGYGTGDDTYVNIDQNNGITVKCGGDTTFEISDSDGNQIVSSISGDRGLFITTGGGSELRLWGDGAAELIENGQLKAFVIDHPTDSDRYLVHVCAEGPTADVIYRGEAEIRDGQAVVEMPAYFEAATRTNYGRQVQLTPIDELCMAAASRIEGGKFTIRCSGPDGTVVQWLVTAVRADAEQFPVEPLKSEVGVGGTGPYRFLTDPASLRATPRQPVAESVEVRREARMSPELRNRVQAARAARAERKSSSPLS